MYDCLLPLIDGEGKSSWLTVGDGRFGSDAQYLMKHGCQALPTDISDIMLREAKERGLIADYRKENAESLSFPDEAFDYVLCKEAFHHFPRPMIAFYEMLRVVRKGIVLIEPDDHYINHGIGDFIFRKTKDLLRTLMGKQDQRHAFETVGNYVYCLSRREIEKTALGLNLKHLAFHGVNDHYVPGLEQVKAGENTPLEKRTRRIIQLQDLACRLKIKRPRLIVAVIFKKVPSQAILASLRKGGFCLITLPDNPYLG